ncbi:MAG: NBR1-Ig-like domain-containing protein [Anaerolineaceae bacterium]|nr:NBR1-Ig-like domain-containing protein [Anaerolineaceae bacterium]
MFRYKNVAWMVFAAGALTLSACSAKATPTTDANAVYTQAAGTVQAELTKAGELTPSATVTTAPTSTTEPTQASTAAATVPTVGTSPVPVFTATRPVSPDRAEFVSQSVADNTKVNPGQQFTLTWKVKNVGTSTWTTAYLLRYYSGAQMGGAASTNFPKEVKPNETVEVGVNLTAPLSTGTYMGNWVMTNADGVNFFPLYIQIVVGNPPTVTITVVPSATTAATTEVPTNTPTP